jgi:hypothetical protein
MRFATTVVLTEIGNPVPPADDVVEKKRMGAKVTEVASSHVPMLSHPDVVIDVIRTAANAVQKATAAA